MYKIAMLGPYPSTLEDAYSGIGQVMYLLAEEFRKIPEINLLIIGENKKNKNLLYIEEQGIRVIYVPRSPKFLRFITFYTSEALKIIKIINAEKPDLIHIHATPPFVFAGLKLKIPMVITIHGLYSRERKWTSGSFNIKFPYLMRQIAEKFYIRKIKHVITIANYIEKICKIKNPKVVTYPIRNPIDPKFHTLATNKYRPGEFLFVGGIIPRKGLHLLIDAFSKLVRKGYEIRLNIIGKKYPEEIYYYNSLVKKVNDLQLGSRIKFHGAVTQNELYNQMEKSEILCLPSLEESSPLAIIQAMASGKLIIASSVGGIPELIKDGINGFLFEPNNPKNLMLTMIKAISLNDEEKSKMINAARKYTFEHFHLKNVCKRHIEVYKQIIKINSN